MWRVCSSQDGIVALSSPPHPKAARTQWWSFWISDEVGVISYITWSYPTRNASPLTIYSPNHYTADLLENPALEPSRKSPRQDRKSLYFPVSILLEKVTSKIKHYLFLLLQRKRKKNPRLARSIERVPWAMEWKRGKEKRSSRMIYNRPACLPACQWQSISSPFFWKYSSSPFWDG